jgi:hypothetical protein
MNTNRDLLDRLLHLYPIRAVKEFFNLAGSSSSVITEILDNRTSMQIKNFACSQSLQTRQNIYLYSLNKNFNRNHIGNDFPFPIIYEDVLGDFTNIVCLIKSEFEVFVDNPPRRESIHFFQPVRLTFNKRLLRIHFTKLKKNIQTYYDDHIVPKLLRIKNNESETLKKIIDYLGQEFNISSIDINVGIKHLWEIDDIDCRKLKWRDHHSLEMTVMDEDETFKEAYPERYEEVALAPIGASIFTYLLDDDYLCKIFGTNPSTGRLNISKFPKSSDQVNNVIAKILANN